MEPISALGATIGGSALLSTALKAAPVVMTAGSLLTKDKTLKDLLSAGALVSSGANLALEVGAGNIVSQAANAPAVGALANTSAPASASAIQNAAAIQQATAPKVGLADSVKAALTFRELLKPEEKIVKAPESPSPIISGAAGSAMTGAYVPTALRFAAMLRR